MHIVERNFYRLLRAGAFATSEHVEALSAWKWRRLYQLSVMHDVAPLLYQGLERCSDQFFVQVPPKLRQEWSEATVSDADDENVLLAGNHLTNPVLNRRLQTMLDSEDSTIEVRTTLLHMVGIARFVMNAGVPVKRVTDLGLYLRHVGGRIDARQLCDWLRLLGLEPMAELAAAMLVQLLGFEAEELPFVVSYDRQRMERRLEELLRQRNSHAEEWYFSQGKNIFVHTSNSQAMLWHVRRSARYFSYYPMEVTTNFFTAFAHSLSHIEE